MNDLSKNKSIRKLTATSFKKEKSTSKKQIQFIENNNNYSSDNKKSETNKNLRRISEKEVEMEMEMENDIIDNKQSKLDDDSSKFFLKNKLDNSNNKSLFENKKLTNNSLYKVNISEKKDENIKLSEKDNDKNSNKEIPNDNNLDFIKAIKLIEVLSENIKSLSLLNYNLADTNSDKILENDSQYKIEYLSEIKSNVIFVCITDFERSNEKLKSKKIRSAMFIKNSKAKSNTSLYNLKRNNSENNKGDKYKFRSSSQIKKVKLRQLDEFREEHEKKMNNYKILNNLINSGSNNVQSQNNKIAKYSNSSNKNENNPNLKKNLENFPLNEVYAKNSSLINKNKNKYIRDYLFNILIKKLKQKENANTALMNALLESLSKFLDENKNLNYTNMSFSIVMIIDSYMWVATKGSCRAFASFKNSEEIYNLTSIKFDDNPNNLVKMNNYVSNTNKDEIEIKLLRLPHDIDFIFMLNKDISDILMNKDIVLNMYKSLNDELALNLFGIQNDDNSNAHFTFKVLKNIFELLLYNEKSNLTLSFIQMKHFNSIISKNNEYAQFKEENIIKDNELKKLIRENESKMRRIIELNQNFDCDENYPNFLNKVSNTLDITSTIKNKTESTNNKKSICELVFSCFKSKFNDLSANKNITAAKEENFQSVEIGQKIYDLKLLAESYNKREVELSKILKNNKNIDMYTIDLKKQNSQKRNNADSSTSKSLFKHDSYKSILAFNQKILKNSSKQLNILKQSLDNT